MQELLARAGLASDSDAEGAAAAAGDDEGGGGGGRLARKRRKLQRAAEEGEQAQQQGGDELEDVDAAPQEGGGLEDEDEEVSDGWRDAVHMRGRLGGNGLVAMMRGDHRKGPGWEGARYAWRSLICLFVSQLAAVACPDGSCITACYSGTTSWHAECVAFLTPVYAAPPTVLPTDA
jgi:hypothetical protein